MGTHDVNDRPAIFCAYHFVLAAMSAWSLTSGNACAQASHLPSEGLVRQIDHIIISSDDPEKMMRLLSEKLSLPVAWPFKAYGTFSSGGVSFGNVNIEMGRLSPQPGLVGIGLEPTSSVSEALAGLDARGLRHGAPDPFYQKDASGENHLLWTTFGVTSLPPSDNAFFCKYNRDVDERRARLQHELQNRSGGPLGIESVVELVIGTRDIAATQRDWRLLLGPPRTGEESVWDVGQGPAVRLVAAKEDHLATLRVKVKSLERARGFLRSQNLLGLDGEREISLERSHL